MLVYSHCSDCKTTFCSHWHEASKRRLQFKDDASLKLKSDVTVAQICPNCGNRDAKKNVESDEIFEDIKEPYWI